MEHYVPIITYRIQNFIVPNLIYLFFFLLIILLSFYLMYKKGDKGDLLQEFAIVSLMMFLIFPRANPHYYIFNLFAFICILRIYSNNHWMSVGQKISVFFIYIFSLLIMGSLLPLQFYDKIFPLRNSAFHYFTTYSLFGLGTFITWCLMIWIYSSSKKS